MEIFSDLQRDGLRYIDAANSGGYQPTAQQVNEWVFRRIQRPAQRGPLIEPAKPSAFSGAMESFITERMGSAGDGFRAITDAARGSMLLPGLRESTVLDFLATPANWRGTPARYGPGKPAESYVHHMIRLSWIAADEDGGLRLTLLGRALLRHDALTNETDDEATVVVLEADSELSYPQLLGHIADCGDAFVVDPYAKAEHVWRLLMNTSTTRVLTGPKLSKRDLIELRQLLAVETRPIEVRQAGPGLLHDRFVIGDLGVHQIGTSWNGVGKVLTTLFKHPQVSAERIMEIAEEWWRGAEPIEPAEPLPAEPTDG